jgi:hypothetical protein
VNELEGVSESGECDEYNYIRKVNAIHYEKSI